MKTTTLFTALAITAAMVASSAHAAVITWGSPTQITGLGADISTNGTLIESISGNISNSYTVNGVTFTQGQILDTTTNNDNLGSRIPTLTDTTYRTLLVFASRNSNGADQPITFSGLTIGKKYEIQIWASDNAPTIAQDVGLVLGDGTGVAPTFGTDTTLLYEVVSGGTGQYGIGTFKADATSQQLLVRRWANLTTSATASNQNMVNAIQLRELPTPPVPEPSSLVMGLIGLMFVTISRRRR